MDKHRLEVINGGHEEWVRRFVELQLKDLHEVPLSEEEALFLSQVDLAARAVPQVIEEIILEHGLRALEPAGLAVAASTPANLFDEVRMLLEQGEQYLSIDADGVQLPVLRIDAGAGLAEACYHEGYMFYVSRRDASRELVTRFGGVCISLAGLKRMSLSFDPDSKTISLSES